MRSSLSRALLQSGPAGRQAALNAPLCLGFRRRNSEEFRGHSTELKRHNKRAGKRPARHAIPPWRWKLHALPFLPLSLSCAVRIVRLPASCPLCGRLPHMCVGFCCCCCCPDITAGPAEAREGAEGLGRWVGGACECESKAVSGAFVRRRGA